MLRPDALGGGVTAVSAGDYHTCAVLAGGSAECWGDNRYGELGTSDTKNRLRPTAVLGLGSESGAPVSLVLYVFKFSCSNI